MDEIKKSVTEIEDTILDFSNRTNELIAALKGQIEEQEEYIEMIEQALLDLEGERNEAEIKQILLDPAFDYDDKELEMAAFNAHEIRLLADDIREKHHKRWLAAKESKRREALAQEEKSNALAEYEAGRPAREARKAEIEAIVDGLMGSGITWGVFHIWAHSHTVTSMKSKRTPAQMDFMPPK